MIDKNSDQITPADITQLTTEGVYESQLLEFKRDLPGDRGRPDPWPTGGDFTAYARDHLLREVIAFANAQGGNVIVGMDETRDDPPRAAAICPLPRIHDLATRMQNAARASIDPVLPRPTDPGHRSWRCSRRGRPAFPHRPFSCRPAPGRKRRACLYPAGSQFREDDHARDPGFDA